MINTKLNIVTDFYKFSARFALHPGSGFIRNNFESIAWSRQVYNFQMIINNDNMLEMHGFSYN